MAHILLVEDSPTQAQELAGILEDHGFEVKMAGDAEEGWHFLEHQAFDLVLSDLLLPGISGFELCRRIKKDARFAQLPVVMITRWADPANVLRGLEAGADGFIAKGRESKEIGRRLRRLVDRKPQPAEAPAEDAEVVFLGQQFRVSTSRSQLLEVLLEAFEDVVYVQECRTKELSLLQEAKTALARHAQELMRSEQNLRTQAQLLQSILDRIGEGVVVADKHGKILLCNPAAREIVGVTASDITIDEWAARCGFHGNNPATPYLAGPAPLARAIRGEVVTGAEVFIRNPNLQEGQWLNVTTRPLQDEGGKIWGGVAVFRDMTKSKQAEEEIRKLNESLELRVEERTAELTETNRHLKHRTEENEMFVYSVSHDLRSPLVNLEGFSKELEVVCRNFRDLLAEPEVPAEVRERGLEMLDRDIVESVHFIRTAVKRLSSIIDALLRLSRAGRVEYQLQQVDVQATVQRIIESMRATIEERAASITVKELPPAWGDPTAVEQIFANLIGNALNYLEPKRPGQIEVGSLTPPSAESGTNSLMQTYYVKDNGLGIPEAYRAKLFQVFQRLHPEVAKGEGMGLAIVRRMVERHGGKIWIESAVGTGSTFLVNLPARKEKVNARFLPAVRLPPPISGTRPSQ